jgi:hypothetical protein
LDEQHNLGEDVTGEYLQLDLDEPTDVDEVVIGFRRGGEFYELLSVEPPVEAEVTKR